MGILELLALSILTVAETGAGPILKAVTPPDGFVVADSTAVYKADKLWDYIDGAADAYLRRGVVETATISFRRPNAELPSVTIDLHRFLEPKGPLEMFLEEKGPAAEILPLGSGGAWQEGLLTFWDATYYVRIVSDSPRDSTILFAKALTHALPTKADVLPVFRMFPLENRVDGSEEVHVREFLNIPHFDYINTVRYQDEGGEYQLFLGPNRPPTWVSNLGDKGTVKASPIEQSPIHLIDLADGRNLIVFYIKGSSYLLGYVGQKPDSTRTGVVSRWVEMFEKK
jgi:hypothetical protein